jgi:ArsR family transcriptional regulator
MAHTPPILSRLSALADPTRARALRVLERHELTVAELGDVLQLPQSTTSRHLKVLSEDGWVVWRREGTAALYRMMLDDLDEPARKLWLLVRDEVAQTPAAEQDDPRVERILANRQTRSQAFFASSAGQWDKLRGELFGDRFDLRAIAALLDPSMTFGDLGCGTGQLVETLAPFTERVVAVDNSTEMLRAARKRLARFENVQVKRGTVEALPLEDAELDAAALVLVLHHLPDPGAALAEAARPLKPGGRLLIVDMVRHDHHEYQQTMGHVWLGFDAAQLEGWLKEAGFQAMRLTYLQAETKARGPGLFAATAQRRADVPTAPGRETQRPRTATTPG